MQKLAIELKRKKSVKNFRLTVTKSEASSIGITGKKIGGPYNPVKYLQSSGGDLHIEWKSGEVSILTITNLLLENPKKAINQAELVKYSDPFRKKFLPSYTLRKKTRQFSKDVQKIVENDSSPLVEELRKIISYQERVGSFKHEVSVSASTAETKLINSKGLNLFQKFTNYSINSNIENTLGFELANRDFFKLEKYREDILFLKKLFKAAQTPIRPQDVKDKDMKVIISPEYAWSIFEHFLMRSLNGSQVANKQSRFQIRDFKDKKKILPDWFTLKIDPLKNMMPGAGDFTYEGIKSRRVTFIDGGRLITPILDLKHSKKLKMDPTGPINSPYIINFADKRSIELKEYIENAGEVIFIPYVLGLHTQNYMTGDFSLPAPYSIYIRDGKFIGNIKSIVTGNFFKDIDKNVEIINSSLSPTPGICFKPEITFE